MRNAAHKFKTVALASEKMANTATGSTAEMRLANRNTYSIQRIAKSEKILYKKIIQKLNLSYTPCAYYVKVII